MVELNTIYNEDNISLIRRMPEDFIDLTITSPPYDNLRDYKGYTFDFETLANELYRVTKPGGVVVWVVGDATIKGSETGSSFRQALKFMDVGFNLHDTMIWHKPNAFNFGSNLCYRQSFEYMFILSKGRPKNINIIKDVLTKSPNKTMRGGRKHSNGVRDVTKEFVNGKYKKRDNVWGINVGKEKVEHPAIFPEALAKDHIISWTDKGDLVFDPFMGSGTTAVASLDTGRKYIGAEIAKEYVEIANDRIKNHTAQTDKFNLLEG